MTSSPYQSNHPRVYKYRDSAHPAPAKIDVIAEDPMKFRVGFYFVAPLAAGTSGLVYFLRYPRPSKNLFPESDNELFASSRRQTVEQLPNSILLRSLFVHSFCAHQRLVDLGITLMKIRQHRSIPILDSIVRHTFFAQFCGYFHLFKIFC